MMVPLAGEAEWLAALRGLPTWMAGAEELLVIAPHPDDETLAAGGLIAASTAAGIHVRVVAVTDGEMAYAEAIGKPDFELGELRGGEQTEALARLGVVSGDILRLAVRDSDVAAHEAEIVRRLLPIVSSRSHIIAPWTGDFHPDHEACGRVAEQLARLSGARLSFWFFWTWHRGTPALLQPLPLRKFPLTPEQMQAKKEALQCHHSQLVRVDGDPILPDTLLAPARRDFEVFLDA
jgi:LmbE family N-acetylglucosaminyl deacetylase